MPSESELLAMIPGDLPCDTELAFYGGSFTALPKSVRRGYLHFAREMKRRGRIRSIALSTHPSYVDESIMDELFFYDVDRIELGIQSTDAEVLAKAQRGHGRKEVFTAASLLHQSGLKWGVQLMVGLPGDDRKKDLSSVVELLRFQPHTARIYPVLVIKDTPLSFMFNEGEYIPLSLSEAVFRTAVMAAFFKQGNVDVIRMGLQPTAEICSGSEALLAGPFHPAFGHLVRCYLKQKQLHMLLKDLYGAEPVRVAAPKADLPLLFGQNGETAAALRKQRRFAVSAAELPSGAVALTPYDKNRKHEFLSVLTEEEFLDEYVKTERRTYCI